MPTDTHCEILKNQTCLSSPPPPVDKNATDDCKNATYDRKNATSDCKNATCIHTHMVKFKLNLSNTQRTKHVSTFISPPPLPLKSIMELRYHTNTNHP